MRDAEGLLAAAENEFKRLGRELVSRNEEMEILKGSKGSSNRSSEDPWAD